MKVARQGDASVADNRCIAAEFELLAGVDSPYVPKAYGLLVDGQGRNHLVLEHREGDLLATRLQSSRVDDDEDEHHGLDGAAAFAEQLLLALADVHQHGFHGDLKPSNVLVSAEGRISLIDFGAGRLDEEPGTEMIPAFGTRGYVAPELFLSTDEELDRRKSDLYSLGVVVY
ncbi:MAG TPA: protein kinase, partial [Enhygromyxa sp.]|nr:protein kinase [Enhygromyxa sp.]